MSALAHQPAVVQHQDLIGVEDGGNALCHDDHGGVVGLLLQRTAQGDIRLVVKGGEAVVEQIDLRLLGNGAGDGEPLLLAAGYIGAALCNGACIASGFASMNSVACAMEAAFFMPASVICAPPNFRLLSMVPLNRTPFWGT